MITDYQSNAYRISYQGVSMTENALENPNLIQVGVVPGCTIMVAPQKSYGIDYLPNGEYRSWTLTGYNTRLNRTEAHYIYARLERNSDDAMVLFSVNDYATDGSIGGENPSEYYYYIRIGKITATDKLEEATLDREITLDYGKLSTPAGQTQDTAGWKELFSVTADDLIRPLKKFTSYIVQGTLSIIGKLVINDKQISDVARQVDEGEFSASDELIPTTALLVGKYITKIREYFLSKDREDQTKFLLRLIGGAEFGTYASGISGAKISSDGAAELLNLLLRGALTIGDYQVKKSGAKIDEEGVADLLSILVRNGIESANFSTGALGAGFCLKKDQNGDSYLEVDRMLVRKVATFIQLLIQQIKHVGGQIILTPASMSCVKVEDKGDFYRCYFENTDGEKTIEQEFEVGDLARAQTFNVKEGVNDNVTNTYYWRAVVGTGDNYIDLSKTDCDADSTEPKAGDDIVQLGNKSDATRQAAIILSAYGNDAPYFKLYRGINSYSLDGKEFVSFSRSEVMIIADTIRFSSGETIEEYINNVTGGLVVDVETAKKAAEEAQKAAAQASEEASKAVERLDSWSADGVISPTEKQSLKDEIARIDADKTQIINGYAKYNLGTPTNYNNAHTAYRAVLVTLTASSPETITIPSDFATKQTAYYTQRTNALTAISNAARDYAETISNDLTSYKKTVSSQFEQTNNSITAAVTSSKEYTDSAVSGIQIGGRNLCLDSNKEDKPLQGISPTSRYKILNVDTSIKQGKILESERYYTLSIWYKPYNNSDPNKPFTSFPIGQAPGGDGWSLRFWKRDGTVINEGEYYKWTGTIKAQVGVILRANPNVGFVLEDSSQKTGMSLYKYKLEEGNKPTDWSPAPEDSENALTEYKKEVTSKFSVLEGEISSKVSSTEITTIKQEILNTAASDATTKANNAKNEATSTAASDATNKANQARNDAIATAGSNADKKYATITTVTSMQTSITQLSNSLSLKAEKSEVTAVQNNLDKTNSNLSSLTTRVSEAEIALQPDNIWIGISSKVTTTSKVNNIVPDSCFDDANYSILYSGGQRIQKDSAPSGCPTNYCMKSTASIVYANNGVSVALGEKYYISAVVNASSANYEVLVGLMLKSNTGSYSYLPIEGVAAKKSGWQTISGYVTIPNNILDARIYFKINGSSSLGTAYFTKVYAYKVDESVNQNYALLTSEEKKQTTFSNVASQWWDTYSVEDLGVADCICTLSFKYEASNLLFNNTQTNVAQITAYVGTSSISKQCSFTLKGNGTGEFISEPFAIPRSESNKVRFKLSYISSVLQDNKPIGYFRIFKLKLEKGERSTPWSAAPSDYSTTEEIKTGIEITKNQISILGRNISLTGMVTFSSCDSKLQSTINNKADSGDVTSDINSSKEDMAKKLGYASYADMVSAATAGNTIIEGGHIRTSLIETDTLVVKTLNATNTDGISTIVDKNGVDISKSNNLLLRIFFNNLGADNYGDISMFSYNKSTNRKSRAMAIVPSGIEMYSYDGSEAEILKDETRLSLGELKMLDKTKSGILINKTGITLNYSTNGGVSRYIVKHAKCIYSAYISSSGSVVNRTGANVPNSSGNPITFSTSKTGTGTYKVTHNIGDTSYKVQITPIRGTYFPIVCVKERTSSYFVYSTAHYAPLGGTHGFTDADCAAFVNVYYESPKLGTF